MVQVLVRGEWVESYLVLTTTNMLDLYQDTTKAIRLMLTSIFFFQDFSISNFFNYEFCYLNKTVF